jgi:hypothetical protein
VWSDLAGRQVLIFRKGVGALERIPEITAEENSVEMKIDHFPSAGKEQTTHSTAKLSPLAAAGLLRLARNSSPSELREQIEKTFSGGKKIIQSKVSTFDASKDYVHGLTLTATLTVEDTPLQTSAGLAFPVPSELSRISDIRPEQLDLGIELGTPEFFSLTYSTPAENLVGKLPESCSATSRWVTLERNYSIENGRILIRSLTKRNATFITLNELRSAEFANLQRDINNCFDKRLLIFKK